MVVMGGSHEFGGSMGARNVDPPFGTPLTLQGMLKEAPVEKAIQS